VAADAEDPQLARAYWVVAPGVGEIRDEPLAKPSAADVVVRARYSGVSRGTESLIFRGRVPASEYQRMKAPFQAGELPAPVKYGYSSVGTVEVGPNPLRGCDVFTLYPHQTRYVVPAAAVHVLPAGVPPERAILAANMETAINGVWDAEARPHDRITVVGGGTVGCLTAWAAAHMSGCAVELVDTNPARAAVARRLGVAFAQPATAAAGVPIVIHASGSPAGLELALDLAAFEGTIVEMSWYGSQAVAVPLGGAFHSQRLTIKSSQVGHVARPKRAEYDRNQRMALALSLLADPALDVLITGDSRFDDLPRTMARLADSPGDELCHRIRY
jgi:2-desacetyl-2-hydroxyethyl bacteriochlorophyllide A dehydrogenase